MDNQTTGSSLTGLSDEQAISRFADSLIDAKGLGGLDDERKAKIKAEIEEKTVDTINQAIIYALPEDKFEELEALSDRENVTAAEVSELIKNSGVDVQKIVTKTMEKIQKSFLDGEVA